MSTSSPALSRFLARLLRRWHNLDLIRAVCAKICSLDYMEDEGVLVEPLLTLVEVITSASE